MSQNITVLFAPTHGYEHLNACHGLADEFRDRGHRVVFAIDKVFKSRLTSYGFEEELYDSPRNDNESDNEFWPKFVAQNSAVLKRTPIEIVEKFSVKALEKMLSHIKEIDDIYKEIVERVKPDVIIIDSYICSPALTNSGIPWVWLFSAAPHMCFPQINPYVSKNDIPPAWSGLPSKGNEQEWIKFREQWNDLFSNLRHNLNEWVVSKGAPELPPNALHPQSPYLNIYIYPEELDYRVIKPLPNNWLQVDSFVRNTDENFSIPEELKRKGGNLVYLSMGTFASADLELMKRITGILSKSGHRFIVSKGPLHDRYELPNNMWGQKMLPQTKVIPLVDLVITHGGNNTITESFYFGKPVIVLPLFADQLDNAQRIKELGFGVTFNPYTCSESVLIGTIDAMINDFALKRKLDTISHRMQNSHDKKRAADLIESIANQFC